MGAASVEPAPFTVDLPPPELLELFEAPGAPTPPEVELELELEPQAATMSDARIADAIAPIRRCL